MTTQTVAREAIYDHFITEWGNTTPIAFDNRRFVPPVGSAWVRLAVRHTDSEQESLGGTGQRRFMRRGSVFLQVFTPENDGQRRADLLVDQARPIFEGFTLNNNDIRFTNAIVTELGVDDDKWNVVLIEFVFQYDQRR